MITTGTKTDDHHRNKDNGGGYAAPDAPSRAAQDTGAAPPASRVADAIATATSYGRP
jgi:hypothetical protein